MADVLIANRIEAGLCAVCRHVRIVRSDRGSIFYQCRLSLTDPRFVPYPRLPVRKCSGFEADTQKPEAQSD